MTNITKPLIWHDPYEHTDDEGHHWLADAFGFNGFYQITHIGGTNCTLEIYDSRSTPSGNLEQSKETAQADFEARVRRSLTEEASFALHTIIRAETAG